MVQMDAITQAGDLQVRDEPVPESRASKKLGEHFIVRMPSELHRQLALEAAESVGSLKHSASDKLSRKCS